MKAKFPDYNFRFPSYMHESVNYDKTKLPYPYRATPETLQNLCGSAIDAITRAAADKWSITEVGQWLNDLGYADYEAAFRVNQIDGRKLLLIDAQALLAMNIHDFHIIKNICNNIKKLFSNELCFPQSDVAQSALYRFYRARIGKKYENLNKTDIFRKLFILRPKAPYLDDWELLENHLNTERRKDDKILFGGMHRSQLYKDIRKVPENEESNFVNKDYDILSESCESYYND